MKDQALSKLDKEVFAKREQEKRDWIEYRRSEEFLAIRAIDIKIDEKLKKMKWSNEHGGTQLEEEVFLKDIEELDDLADAIRFRREREENIDAWQFGEIDGEKWRLLDVKFAVRMAKKFGMELPYRLRGEEETFKEAIERLKRSIEIPLERHLLDMIDEETDELS